MPAISVADVNWKAAGNDSTIVPLSGVTLCGFYIPSDFTGTSLKVKVTYNKDSVNPVTMIDSTGADVSYTVAAGKYLKVNPADFAGVEAFQLTSGSSEADGRLVRAAVREIE